MTLAATSDYLEDALLNAVLRNTSYTSPATVYLALLTGDPTDDASGMSNELSGGSYARASIAFDAPSGGSVANTADLEFTNLSGVSVTPISHVAILDASSGGNLLFHGALASSKVVPDGEDFVIRAGDLVVTLT